jgi:actin-related protein
MQIFDVEGRVQSWEGYEAILDQAFYKTLGWPQGDEGYVIVTENPLRASRHDRERLAQMLFEVCNVRGLHILDSCVACLYAAGVLTGTTVDMGHSGTTIGLVRFRSMHQHLAADVDAAA